MTSNAPQSSAGGPDDAVPDGPTIVQVTPKLNSGGVERGTLEIAEAIGLAGGNAIVVSEGGRMASQLEGLGAKLIEMPVASKNPLTMRLNAKRLYRLITDRGVDLIHARSRAPAWSALWAAKKAGVPFVTTYHGAYDESLPLKRLYNSVMARGDIVIAISEHIKRLIQERHGTPEERIVTIPRGADLRLFSEESTPIANVSALAADWGVLHEPRPILMFPGRLTRWKGQTLFLEALADVKAKRGSEAFLALIVGGDHDDKSGAGFRAELEQIIEDRALGDVVRMVGHCDDMAAAYRLASVAVTASLEPEAFGRAPVEAMAMGAPVIAPAHGGALETLEDGVTGWLFGPGEAESLAMAIEHVLDLGPDGRREVGAAGVKRARAQFSVTRMQASTIEVYQRLLDAEGRAP